MEKQLTKEDRILRVFHGPVNIGGTGRFLADWQRNKGAISDFITFSEHLYVRKPAHLTLHIRKYGLLTKILIVLSTFLQCFVKYDIYHFNFGNSLLPFNIDLPLLKLFRKKILMTYWGSDIRLMGVEKSRNPYHHLMNFGKYHERSDIWKKLKMRWQGIWIDRFFACRSLYEWAIQTIPERKVIEHIWLHNMTILSDYKPTFQTKKIPTIVHAPTVATIKGSDYIEEVIAELKAEGYVFKYMRLEGVAHIDAQRVYQEEADIIVDQLYAGDQGILATEGMYYGKPVCSFIMDDVLRMYPDLPLVNSTIETLKDRLIWLIEHPEERVRIGKAGRTFIEKHCDAERINKQVWEIYQELMN